MHNPFQETAIDGASDLALVEQSKSGDRASLEKLILRHQAWIYNIAVRMVFEPHDAEEVTQEILIKVVTHLGTFQGGSSFRTWLYRIVTNHVLNMKRRRAEEVTSTFDRYGQAINDVPDLDLPDPRSLPVELPLLVEETKISCTTGMLLCLDRQQRLIFTLGAIFAASDIVAAEVLEITPDNFRQRLARARRDLYQFMNGQCGLVNQANSCRCPKKTRGFIEQGHVDPVHLRFVNQHMVHVREVVQETITDLTEVTDHEFTALFRDHPFLSPADQSRWLKELLENARIRSALRLN